MYLIRIVQHFRHLPNNLRAKRKLFGWQQRQFHPLVRLKGYYEQNCRIFINLRAFQIYDTSLTQLF